MSGCSIEVVRFLMVHYPDAIYVKTKTSNITQWQILYWKEAHTNAVLPKTL